MTVYESEANPPLGKRVSFSFGHYFERGSLESWRADVPDGLFPGLPGGPSSGVGRGTDFGADRPRQLPAGNRTFPAL